MVTPEQQHTTTTAFQGQETSSVDPRELLMAFLRNWYWIAICALIGFVLARLYLRYTEPVYQANCQVLIKEDGESGGVLSEEAVLEEIGLLRSGNNLNNEMQILKSRTLMAQVVDELGLGVRYYGLVRIKNSEVYTDSPIRVDSIHTYNGRRLNLELNIEYVDSSRFLVIQDDSSQ